VWFDDTVAVEVGAEVAMAGEEADGIGSGELVHQGTQGLFLCGSSGVGGVAVSVKSALVADAYAVGVVALGMGAWRFKGAHRVDGSVLGDVEVVATIAETTLQVVGQQLGGEVVDRGFGGRAMDYDAIDESHRFYCLG